MSISYVGMRVYALFTYGKLFSATTYFGAGYLFADYEAISTGPSSSLSEIIFVDPQKGLVRLNTKFFENSVITGV